MTPKFSSSKSETLCFCQLDGSGQGKVTARFGCKFACGKEIWLLVVAVTGWRKDSRTEHFFEEAVARRTWGKGVESGLVETQRDDRVDLSRSFLPGEIGLAVTLLGVRRHGLLLIA